VQTRKHRMVLIINVAARRLRCIFISSRIKTDNNEVMFFS